MEQQIALLLIALYLTLSFVYSIIEKIYHWKNSVLYYKEHFKNSFLKHYIPASLVLVLVLEFLCVGLNTAGFYYLLTKGISEILLWGLVSVSFTLILLMTGQRIAQDYSGAMNITVYFILTVMGIFILEIF